MNKRSQNYLFKRFEQFFPSIEQRTPDKSCMAFGFNVGDGWYPLVKTLLEEIEMYSKMFPIHFMTFQIAQVKEKFGGLRVYFRGDLVDDILVEEMWKLTTDAELKSFNICEDCGKPGMLRKDRPWFRTLCNKCSVLDITERENRRDKSMEAWKRLRKQWKRYGYK